MLLYNGIVRGERFIATISMSPFHGYRFVRGQRCASSPLRDASFTGGGRERERAAMVHRVSMRSPRSDSFLRFSSSQRDSSSLLSLCTKISALEWILDKWFPRSHPLCSQKKKKRKRKETKSLKPGTEKIGEQIDKSGAEISESGGDRKRRYRGPCFVSYARERRSRSTAKKWSGCTCRSVKVHLKRVGRGTDEKLSRKG